MKFTFAIICLLSGVIIPQITWAGNGGPGTGFARGSTPEDVRDAIDNLGINYPSWPTLEIVSTFANSNSWSSGDGGTLWKGKRQLLAKQLTSVNMLIDYTHDDKSINSYGLWVDASKTQIIKKEHGPCIDLDGNKADSSTQKKYHAPVCFSIQRLTRIPKFALKDTVLALFFHELTHHFGFEDDVANQVQDLILSDEGRLKFGRDPFLNSLFSLVGDAQTSSWQVVREDISNLGIKCSLLGRLTGQMVSVETVSKGLIKMKYAVGATTFSATEKDFNDSIEPSVLIAWRTFNGSGCDGKPAALTDDQIKSNIQEISVRLSNFLIGLRK